MKAWSILPTPFVSRLWCPSKTVPLKGYLVVLTMLGTVSLTVLHPKYSISPTTSSIPWMPSLTAVTACMAPGQGMSGKL